MVKVVGQDNTVSVEGYAGKALIDPAIVLVGKDGKDGKDGIPGPEGLPGRDGVDGIDGKDGKDGRDGIDGKDGISYWIEYDKKTNTLVFKNDGGKKNPDPVKLAPLAKGWGYGAGRGGGQVQADWNQTDKNNPTYIKNKPAVHNIRFLVVEELPTVGDPWTIYMIQESENQRGGSGGNIYSEWVFVENEITHTLSWEKFGTDVDLSGYVKTNDPKYAALNVQYKENIVPAQDLDLAAITVDKGLATYGFSYDGVEGALVCENTGMDDTFAYGKITVTVPYPTTLTIYFKQNSEMNYDYGEISNLDSYLTYDNSEDEDILSWSGKYEGEYTGSVTLNVPAGEHFFTFKYVKDSSDSYGNDSFMITRITRGSYSDKKLVEYSSQQEIDLYVKKKDIASSVNSDSTNSQVVGAKLFYDTCGDIESTINAIRGV